ncbi:hypothetical protein M0657_010740 [Pyricularia oryzae]|nr:hypothetical protein M0657_010740 [Pyricularia oryzae]
MELSWQRLGDPTQPYPPTNERNKLTSDIKVGLILSPVVMSRLIRRANDSGHSSLASDVCLTS